MKEVLVLLILSFSTVLHAQDSLDMKKIKNLMSYDSLMQARQGEFGDSLYDINYVDTIFYDDTFMVAEKWSLGLIFATFSLDSPNYTALNKYLDYFNNSGTRLILRTGYNPVIPNVKELLESEIKYKYKRVWLGQIGGCYISPEAKLFIEFIKNYNDQIKP